jgi:hypothetical protein
LKTATEIEGEWLAALNQETKSLFLAKLMRSLTVVGRDSYTVQAEGLDRPADLRRINEIQYRVSACLCNMLLGKAEVSFQQAMAVWVLEEARPELRQLLQWAWENSK